MRRIATAIILIAFVTGSGRLIAEPKPSGESCRPKPVGGVKKLTENTIYPQFAKECKLESDVVLSFQVESKGKVSLIKIVKSGGPMFDNSAAKALADTRWSPARQNGEPVAAICSQRFMYRMR